nr:hypothetical protein GTC16762_31750 [Pigmentibacter ruber]
MELNSKVELTDIAKKIIDERLTNKLVINYSIFFIVVNWKFFLIIFSGLDIDKKICQIEKLHNSSFYLCPLLIAILAIIILPVCQFPKTIGLFPKPLRLESVRLSEVPIFFAFFSRND